MFTEEEIEVTCQRKEHVGSFVKIYYGMTGYEPNAANITRHLEFHIQSDVVSWISLDDYYKVNVLARKRL